MIDFEFIDRATKLIKNDPEYKINRRKENNLRWNNKNREYLRECIRRYSKTEKGKKACKRRYALYHKKIKYFNSILTKEEKLQIKYIYENCPSGYEVDHIIPICKGGIHHPCNLQYLTKKQNRLKGQCLPDEIDMSELIKIKD